MPCAGVTKHPKIFGKEPCPHPRGNQRGSREATAEAHEEAGSLLGWVEQVRERQHRRVVFGYELALLEHVGDGAVAATGLEPAQGWPRVRRRSARSRRPRRGPEVLRFALDDLVVWQVELALRDNEGGPSEPGSSGGSSWISISANFPV